MNPFIVISLGGSLVAPDGVDVAFVKNFLDLILERIKIGERFVIIVGGGKTARKYQEASSALGVVSKEDKDWVGIFATRLNAELVRAVFGGKAHAEVITDPEGLSGARSPVIICAGWKPGCSTDFDSVLVAKKVGAKRVVNLSNIDFVYTKDPKKFSDAKKIETIGWSSFRENILPDEWNPGINAPFDPVAAKRAEELGLEVAIMNGNNLENFRNYLDGAKFYGTVIS